jgi:hypothetical protein
LASARPANAPALKAESIVGAVAGVGLPTPAIKTYLDDTGNLRRLREPGGCLEAVISARAAGVIHW